MRGGFVDEDGDQVTPEREFSYDTLILAIGSMITKVTMNMCGTLTPDGSAQTVKLAWISPLRTLFIFSTGARKEAFSLTVEKLAEAYRQHSVRPVRQDGVVARALADAMAVNDPGAAAA